MRIGCFPDLQAAEGRPYHHVRWVGTHYATEVMPGVFIIKGDWWDYKALSWYDRGKKVLEFVRLSEDHDAGCRALDMLLDYLCGSRYSPDRMIFLAGNHEWRVDRYMNDNPQIDTLPDYRYEVESRGFEFYEFLEPVEIEEVYFAHFFNKTSKGTVTASSQRNGAANARAQLDGNKISCVSGHKQGLDYANHPCIDGRIRHSVIAGSCYLHRESYLGPQGNDHWQGIDWYDNVYRGELDPHFVSLNTLEKMYG